MIAVLGLLIVVGCVAGWVAHRREQYRRQWVSPAWLEEQRRDERRLGVPWLPPWNWAYLIDQMKRKDGRA
jgi:hypothetical protein